MPDIYKYLSFVFSFYSREHAPIHVHVEKQDRECKCEITYDNGLLNLKWKKVKGSMPLSSTEMSSAEELIKKHHLDIVNKWNQFFIFGKQVKCEKINKL